MVVEKLIPKKEVWALPQCIYKSKTAYRYADYPRMFYAEYEYWYEERLFLIGSFDVGCPIMVDAETGAYAVQPLDFHKKPTIKMILDKFKEKVLRSSKSIHEVVQSFKSNNLDLELWLVNSLII